MTLSGALVMKSAFATVLTTVGLVSLAASSRAAEPPGDPVKVIFDTDMDSDCDDVGALAVLHALADRGEAVILATVVSSQNPWSPACAAALNTFYGRPDVPVGCPKKGGANQPSKYARAIAERFPQTLGSADKVPDALAVYRRVLANQKDASVVIVTVGYLTNVADLLRLPTEGAEPSGLDLIKRKVRLWVCMGGNFVGRPAVDDLKLGNNNFTTDKAASLYAIQNWPGDVMFVGREIGSVPSGLKVGARLRELPENNPVRVAYALWFGGEPKDRHVADQTAVLFAVRGLGDYWEAETRGWIDLQPGMTFRWRYNRDGRQGYLLKRLVAGRSNDRAIERVIEGLMLQPPRRAKGV
jgi:hypothetical protein